MTLRYRSGLTFFLKQMPCSLYTDSELVLFL
jgi:hypothetical protein